MTRVLFKASWKEAHTSVFWIYRTHSCACWTWPEHAVCLGFLDVLQSSSNSSPEWAADILKSRINCHYLEHSGCNCMCWRPYLCIFTVHVWSSGELFRVVLGCTQWSCSQIKYVISWWQKGTFQWKSVWIAALTSTSFQAGFIDTPPVLWEEFGRPKLVYPLKSKRFIKLRQWSVWILLFHFQTDLGWHS